MYHVWMPIGGRAGLMTFLWLVLLLWGLLGADACSAQHVHVEQMTRPHHRQWWRRSVMPNARSQSPHTGASRSASQRSAAIGATRIDRTFVPGQGVEGGVW